MLFEVEADAVGARLDKYLANQVQMPRSRIQRWILAGVVLRNGAPTVASKTLSLGDSLEVLESAIEASEPVPLAAETWPESITVVEETNTFIVINKPSRLVVHPGAGHTTGTLANYLVGRWPEIAQVGNSQRPGIVHRLDMGTTGVMVVARTKKGYDRLALAFSERQVDKIYLALVYGHMADLLDIDLPIGRHPNDRRRMTIRRTGRQARSTVTPLAHAGDGNISLVAIRLHTGRTHQIRVHLKAAKHPLIGDPTYGEARWKEQVPRFRKPLRNFPRPALHAYQLSFQDPSMGKQNTYVAPVPDDLAALWDTLRMRCDANSIDELLGKVPTPEDTTP